MKKLMFTIAILGISIFANAETLRFRTKLGIDLLQPVKVECEEPTPEFVKVKTNTAYVVFDISKLSKPETEEPLPEFVKEIVNS